MAWYRTGTVSVTASSTTVTGSGTAFVANARVGDAFIGPDGRLYEISNVASDTAISILPAYIGSTASGQGYAIAPVQGYVKKLADEAGQLLNEYGNTVDTLGTAATRDVTTSPTDTTADRILQVGDGGLLSLNQPEFTGDCNNLNATGFYRIAPSATNAAAPARGIIITVNGGSSETAQLWQGLQNNITYCRRKQSGSWQSWQMNYGQSNIAGNVTQNGGTPTGAIIQRGSNANGRYTLYADGTAIWDKSGAAITTNPFTPVGAVTSVDANKLRFGYWF